MKFSVDKFFPRLVLLCLLAAQHTFGQNSVLVNFGSDSCGGSGTPYFSMISNPLGAVPVQLANCNFSQQVPDIFSVFVAYNPKNNKIYIADVRTLVQTNIWLLDIGLPSDIGCPPTIPVAPTYSYSYVSNNFEFDNNGNLWSFSHYNDTIGQCNLDKFDVNTGNVLSSKILQFPPGHFPTTIQSGDLTILPNGRLFATLGSGTCQLYEISNYSGSGTNAVVTYLQTLPKDCYGVAYLNGNLELTGFVPGSSCYYYNYDIAHNQLGPEQAFQNGALPIDNTSFTPAVGVTKRLLSATKINTSTADLIYEVYVENMGNVVINNVNVTDNLVAGFGPGNVSNINVSFVPGSNAAGLLLNPSFNGSTLSSLLSPGQTLPNRILSNNNYFFKVQLKCRVSNLNPSTTYLNSAIASGEIGSAGTSSLVNVSDSSNNGDSTKIDPNNNGNPSDIGENVPTPFVLGALPVQFIEVSVQPSGSADALISWQVAVPMINAATFDIEYSTDGLQWNRAGEIYIENPNQSQFEFLHQHIPAGNLFYRIKQTDIGGTFIYSKTAYLKGNRAAPIFRIFPNPANEYIGIESSSVSKGTQVLLFDATGRKLSEQVLIGQQTQINVNKLPAGTYLLQLKGDFGNILKKIIVKH